MKGDGSYDRQAPIASESKEGGEDDHRCFAAHVFLRRLGRGGTNVQGPIAKLDYMLLPRLTLTAKGYFVNFIDRPAGANDSTVNRVQLDALFAF
jgi:hypothetical protein